MRYVLAFILIGCLLVGGLWVQAQSGGDYRLLWQTMDSGGGLSSGGTYRINSTMGQPNVGEASGGEYDLQSGFWPATPAEGALFFVYLPTVLK